MKLTDVKNFWTDCKEQEQPCIFDSHNGIYNLAYVVQLAIDYGFNSKFSKEDTADNLLEKSEILYEEVIQAEYYLTKLLPDNYFFGTNEDSGDWGVFKLQEDETD